MASRRRVLVRVLVTTALALLAAPACSVRSSDSEAAEPGTARVVRVVDGDTVVVRFAGAPVEETVRLIGIDTPEAVDPRSPVECFGVEASERTKALLPVGTAVRLTRDVEPRDRYDRLLAYVHRADDELFVNLALAEEGYASVLTYPPNVAHEGDLTRAASTARAGGLGLWGACGGPD